MNQKESKEELLKELEIIKKWEKNQEKDSLLDLLGRLPFVILDKITPKFIHKKIGQLLDELGNFIQSGGQYLTSEQSVFKHFKKEFKGDETITIEMVSQLPIQTMSKVSKKISKTKVNVATAQGATTGIGGVYTLAIDIPTVLGISLKTIQEIAICYGYNPREREERLFILKCLQYSSSNKIGKKTILKELAAMNSSKNEIETNAISKIQGWREVVAAYRENYGIKKLLQMVPIAGIVIGMQINRSTIKEVAEVGEMLYKKRRIMERLSKK